MHRPILEDCCAGATMFVGRIPVPDALFLPNTRVQNHDWHVSIVSSSCLGCSSLDWQFEFSIEGINPGKIIDVVRLCDSCICPFWSNQYSLHGSE